MTDMFLFVISSLLASSVAIDRFIGEYRFALIVLAVHPVVMFHWTLWFIRTLKQLKG